MHYKIRIAKRAAQEISAGQIVNLGIGIPTLLLEYVGPDSGVLVQSENGLLGMGSRAAAGQEDPRVIDAGAAYTTVQPGGSFFDTAMSFAMIRGGRIDIAFLGALEVSQHGDLANWIIPGKMTPGIGGGMELAQKARRVVVLTTHVAKSGAPKILPECTLPLTAPGCVATIISDLAVIDVRSDGLWLTELAEGVSSDEVSAKTAAPLNIAPGNLPAF